MKNVVRQSLVEEQGHLCAYCMCEIPRTDVPTSGKIAPITIEHLIPRNPADGRDVGQGLDYNNLVAVCHGNRAPKSTGHTIIDLTCDAHRENIELKKVNPCDASTLTSIEYETNGVIKSNDSDVNFDLNDTLNLNHSRLKSERKAVLDALVTDMSALLDDESARNEYVQVRLSGFESETDPKTSYVGILTWYLKGFLNAS